MSTNLMRFVMFGQCPPKDEEHDSHGNSIARCEECHRTQKTFGNGEWLAFEHWVCSECMGETRIFTLAEHERDERE